MCSGKDGERVRLMGREVVKLVTPGTLLEPLDQSANYLLCIATGPGRTLGLAWVDVSTAEFQVQDLHTHMHTHIMHMCLVSRQ